MKLTWFSNAPWANTGYGTQTRLFVPRIKADGHEIAIAANYGLQAGPSIWNGIPVLPTGYSGHSEDVLVPHHQAWAGDWLLTLYDVWPLRSAPDHDKTRVASWTPVDHQPVPPEVLEWAKLHYTIAMSKFGQAELAKAGIDARYVPHGIDTKVFRPSPSNLRERQGIPEDAFLITINAANKGGTPVRKAWSEMLSAVSLFMGRRSDAFVYIHSNLVGIGGTAPHLEILLRAVGVPEDRVRIVSQYPYLTGQIPDTALAEAYTASDVLLATSMGEGFGIPVVEAQACGLPVIVTDFSAQPELCGAGWRVGFQPWFDHFQGAFLATPLIAEILRALESAYERKGDQSLREEALQFAQAYDVDAVYATYWRPVLVELEKLLEPPKLSRQQKRAAGRKVRKAA